MHQVCFLCRFWLLDGSWWSVMLPDDTWTPWCCQGDRKLYVPPSIGSRLWRSYRETVSKPVPDDNPNASPFSRIVFTVLFDFDRQHQNWQIHNRMPVLFTDESSFTESTTDRRARVWGPQGERYTDSNIVHVDRYDGGSPWSGSRYHWMVVQTCMCLLEAV